MKISCVTECVLNEEEEEEDENNLRAKIMETTNRRSCVLRHGSKETTTQIQKWNCNYNLITAVTIKPEIIHSTIPMIYRTRHIPYNTYIVLGLIPQ